MARKYGQRPDASKFAEAWAELPWRQQQQLIREVRAALREVQAAADSEAPEPQRQKPKTAPRRHIRFAGGEMQVLASARRPVSPQRQRRIDAAWDKLSTDVQETKRQR